MIAIDTFAPKRGETFSFSLDIDPSYTGSVLLDGTETVTCDVKLALPGKMVPPDSASVVTSITPVFVAATDDDVAHWLFHMTAAQTDALEPETYITDAKIVSSSGATFKPDPVAIVLQGVVTR